MKLKVYQQGGGLIYTPFIPGSSASQNNSGNKSKNDEDEPKLDPLDKEILALMKDQNLLPSDIQAISKSLMAFQRSTQKLASLGTDSYRSVMPGMIRIMNMVSVAKFNKDQWTNAIAEMKKHDAGSEVAMDSYGRMYVQNENGEISKISPNEFNAEKHVPISNSELLQYRERVAGMNESILNSMDDLVGKKDVYQAINEIIKAFGTTEQVAFLTKDKAAQAVILDANSPDGLYKLTEKHTAADLKSAFEVIYNELPKNMQNLLRANAALSGEKDSTLGAYKMIYNILVNNTSKSITGDYDSTASKAAGFGGAGSGENGATNLTEYSYIESLATGKNFLPPTYTTFNPTSSVSLHAPIQNTGALMRKDGITPVGPGMVDSILETVEGLKQISPQYTVTFGDQILDASAQGALMYDGSALQRIKMPYKEVNGEITVDWGTLEKLEEINSQLQQSGATPGMIQELLKNEPNLVYNSQTGMVESVNNMWFLTFGAMIGDNFVQGLNVSSRYIEPMNQELSDFWDKKYEEATQYGFVNHDKNAPKRTGAPTDKGFFGIDWTGTDYYHGNVFIPILNEMAGATQYYSKSTHMNNTQTYAMNQREQAIQQQVETGQRKFNW